MTLLAEHVTAPDGTPPFGRVRVWLADPAGGEVIGYLADSTLVTSKTTRIDADGTWEIELPANELVVAPTGTRWAVELLDSLNATVRYCVVPDVDEITVQDCLVESPDDYDASALAAHAAALDVHGLAALRARVDDLEAEVEALKLYAITIGRPEDA